MLSERENYFLDSLQQKYKKKIFAFLKKGNFETITVDGEELSFAWRPHLNELEDSRGETTEMLLNDCIVAIKKSIAAEKKQKRKIKKAYINRNK